MDFLKNLSDSEYLYNLGEKVLEIGIDISIIYTALSSTIYLSLVNILGKTFLESTALIAIGIISIGFYILVATVIISLIIGILAYIKSKKEIYDE